MAGVVRRVLQETEIQRTIVNKDVALELDLGNLTGSDVNPIDIKRLRSETEQYLQALTRDNTQLLINSLWDLPTEVLENIKVAKLPAPVTRLPREKPIPKPKALTRWQEYAQKKGVKKRKKEKLKWDETGKEWKPRWGYRSKGNTENDWMIEIPDNADPTVDYFAKKKEEKRERIAKNEYQRLRNIAKAHKTKVPGIGITPSENKGKKEVAKVLAVAKTATASLGKFSDPLPKEAKTPRLGKKRKFEPIIMDANKEKQKNMAILEQITKKQPKLDIEKGVNATVQPKQKHKKNKKGNLRQGKIKQKRRHGGKRIKQKKNSI